MPEMLTIQTKSGNEKTITENHRALKTWEQIRKSFDQAAKANPHASFYHLCRVVAEEFEYTVQHVWHIMRYDFEYEPKHFKN